MESMRENLHLPTEWTSATIAIAIGAAAVTSVIGIKVVSRIRRNARRRAYKPGVVILHEWGRGRFVPCCSPFALKMETYLRLAKIPYEVDTTEPAGPKGKTPWITLDGEDVADTELIIEFLNKKFDVDLNSGINNETKAIHLAFRVMVDEFLFWTSVLYRCYHWDTCVISIQKWPWYVYLYMPLVARHYKKQAYSHGIGRHSEEINAQFAEKGLRALSTYLGTKWFFGGNKPAEVDCAIFGLVAQQVWSNPGSPHEALVNGELKNLREYCNRMKDLIWPDWEQCLDN